MITENLEDIICGLIPGLEEMYGGLRIKEGTSKIMFGRPFIGRQKG